MKIEDTLTATFLSRENRFVARVMIGDVAERVHVKNTGRLGELLVPGARVLLQRASGEGRMTAYDLIGAYREGRLFNLDSQACNRVVGEWLSRQLPSPPRPEYRYGDSRIDFFWELEGRPYLLEVKGCTLEREGRGYFPDAPTERGTRHLRELTQALQKGYSAHVGFAIMMEGVREVLPNTETDPAFARALEEAREAGVGINFFLTRVREEEVTVSACIGPLGELQRTGQGTEGR